MHGGITMYRRVVQWVREAHELLDANPHGDAAVIQATHLLALVLDVVDRPLDKTWTVAEILANEG